ncbi:hypothetical protein [Angustibacter aerolatus]
MSDERPASGTGAPRPGHGRSWWASTRPRTLLVLGVLGAVLAVVQLALGAARGHRLNALSGLFWLAWSAYHLRAWRRRRRDDVRRSSGRG